MKLLHRNSPQSSSSLPRQRCNHRLAVVVDPTDRELHELEAMLARCPNCSQWVPGDGPIMAVLTGCDRAPAHTMLEPMSDGWSNIKSRDPRHDDGTAFEIDFRLIVMKMLRQRVYWRECLTQLCQVLSGTLSTRKETDVGSESIDPRHEHADFLRRISFLPILNRV